MEDDVLEDVADAVFLGLGVEDGAQLTLAQQGILLFLASAQGNDAARHSLQGIHGGGGRVDLVEQDVASAEQTGVLVEGKVLGGDKLHALGVFCLQLAGHLEQDVRPLQFTPLTLYADEDAELRALIPHLWPLIPHLYRKGDEGGLVLQVGLGPVGNVVFVEGGDDAVAGVGDVLAAAHHLRVTEPAVEVLAVPRVVNLAGGGVEVAVGERAADVAVVDVVVVVAEGAKEHAPVVAPQPVVEAEAALGLQLDIVDGVDELDNVVPPPVAHLALQADEVGERIGQPGAAARQTDVGGVALPFVAVGHQADLVPEVAQRCSKRGVQIAIFAEEQYLHKTFSQNNQKRYDYPQ